jgi:hypothetical protein
MEPAADIEQEMHRVDRAPGAGVRKRLENSLKKDT